MEANKKIKIDCHIHLVGTGCAGSGCWISPSFRNRYTFRLLKWFYGISNQQMKTSIDNDWAQMIALLIRDSELDCGVVLGFDAVIDPATGNELREKSQIIVPTEWVFRVCQQHPGLLPGPSINPYRKDAVKRLETCIEQGAVLIKWLPSVQAIDPDDGRLDDFYRVAREAHIPILMHMGGERTFHPLLHQASKVEKMKKALDIGVRVICAHTATPLLYSSEPDQIPALRQLLEQYPHLWVDNSGMCNPSRYAHLKRLGKDRLIAERTLYGSDWPVPPNAIYFIKEIGIAKVYQLERLPNANDRDVNIKRYFGYPETTLTQHTNVLANLDRWT